MYINDVYLEKDRILTPIELSLITKKEIEELKSIARQERKNILANIKPDDNISSIIEGTILFKKYENISILKKEIILANAILPNTVEIAEMLNNNGFTLEHLKAIIRFRSILKNILSDEKKLEKELSKEINIYIKVIAILINLFNEQLGINNPTIILNRICEIINKNQHILEELDNPYSLKR